MKRTALALSLAICTLMCAQEAQNTTGYTALKEDFRASSYDWSKEGKAIYDQVMIAKVETSEPRIQKVNAVRIDLTDPRIDFFTSPKAPNAGKTMPDFPDGIIRTRRMRTVTFMDTARKSPKDNGWGVDMIVASNSSPWTPFQAPWNHKYADKLGLIVHDGELVCEGHGTAAFFVTKDRKFYFANAGKDYDISNVRHAMAGFSFCLRDGKEEGAEDKHPRTGYGLSKDCHYMVIVTIDGRQKGYSEGCTVKEVGLWLKYFGCTEGVNMDGGGSTTLVYFDKASKKIVKMNHQSNNAERSNGGNFGIILLPKNKE